MTIREKRRVHDAVFNPGFVTRNSEKKGENKMQNYIYICL